MCLIETGSVHTEFKKMRDREIRFGFLLKLREIDVMNFETHSIATFSFRRRRRSGV